MHLSVFIAFTHSSKTFSASSFGCAILSIAMRTCISVNLSTPITFLFCLTWASTAFETRVQCHLRYPFNLFLCVFVQKDPLQYPLPAPQSSISTLIPYFHAKSRHSSPHSKDVPRVLLSAQPSQVPQSLSDHTHINTFLSAPIRHNLSPQSTIKFYSQSNVDCFPMFVEL
jgi:hypothetical protein